MATPEETALKEAASAARLKLAEQSVASFETAQGDLLAIWNALETKAQGATAVAGVFLGATVSMLTKNPETLNQNERTLILGIAAALTFAVLLALWALTPRPGTLVVDPEDRFRKIRDLLKLEDDAEFLSLLPDFYADNKDAWVKALDSLRTITALKARLLYFAQLATATAVIGAAALVVMMLEQ